ncbi:NUDIX domain-containing protein [Geotoga petraea]|jgi:ADP-ribose pyrophosphatase YjhB (NUDIX family)|uniref:ADP-ribose pyrophosphatase YjhB, NUDIX family n=1 Tax=Geotoga petraea TaxID=28234 RepID=A0A1G6L3H5_9BACT|nr:NUDIX domain-containing protein [Geotoga petraea]MDK2946672.1 hypothetical protein [Geotoga sp.]TGG88821.1 NUDIX domain-containing protein [Geotoga petraea]SDC37638.1 ADP-ribose pyrophosphatase YjhB, NUDIX family [Geotoga petraea]
MKNKNIFYDYKNINKYRTVNYCPNCGEKLAPRDDDFQKCDNCGYVNYVNPQTATAILITDGEKYLLGKRNSENVKNGYWALPGGFIEFKEDFLTAAKREVKEETNLDIKIDKIINVSHNFLNKNLHSLVIVLHATVINGEAKAGDDISQVKWFNYGEDMPEMAFDADIHIINYYYQKNPKGIKIDET